jgi:hypothetical protein
LGEAFDLKYGQTVQLSSNAITVIFQEIEADSRCPAGVECVWEGNAEVLLKVSTTDLSGVYSLNTTLEPKLIDHDGYMLELVSVSPYPVYGEDISEQDYTIRISVTD